MAKQIKKSTGEEKPVLSKTVKVMFDTDTYIHGLEPFAPMIVHEISQEAFDIFKHNGNYKLIE